MCTLPLAPSPCPAGVFPREISQKCFAFGWKPEDTDFKPILFLISTELKSSFGGMTPSDNKDKEDQGPFRS